MAFDPIIDVGVTSTITWTFDDPSGYESTPSAHVVTQGSLMIKENAPIFTLYGTESTRQASNWITNQNDADGAPLLQSVNGESFNGIAPIGTQNAYDSRSGESASYKIRGKASSGRISANTIARSSASASDWNIHVWWMAARNYNFPNHELFVGTWTSTTVPEMGISGDFGTWSTYQFVSNGISVWPNFTTEVDTGISTTSADSLYVLMAGREYSVAGTTFYDQICVVNGTVVVATTLSASALDIPKGLYFGCSIEGQAFQESQTPSYIDNYRCFHGLRYPTVAFVKCPVAIPNSVTAVSAYSVTSTTSGSDYGGSVEVYYKLSTDGGSTFGALKAISLITSETFLGNGSDAIEVWALLVSSSNSPATGIMGLFTPKVDQIQLTFTPRWKEIEAPSTTWTEGV